MELNIQQLWNNLDKLSSDSLESIGREHLEYSNYKIFGYWDEKDKFYDEITFKQPLAIELSSYSIGKTLSHVQEKYWIKLQFKIKALLNNKQKQNFEYYNNIIGEMTLILNPNFQFIDENWLIDINSPFIITKLEDP